MNEFFEKRGLVWEEWRLALTFDNLLCAAAFSGLLAAVISLAIQIVFTVSLVGLRDMGSKVNWVPAVDAAMQVFIHIFMRMKQMRRLNQLRSNCVYVVFAVYKLLFRVRRNVI
ncbi:uncharacterized protein BXIN_1349 [Babesia sp. Xinjiang]|uniref:uncharacterized protein n=1 Tax=Babesia sp. Xinjiang TaxID=462227 RepID=UPI000A24C5B4|nr:uncharacterized protein BXIN_1349 [Babesia sp. Xinjiang]ORM39899.1 hypothetical protein BXIN_1349 [Babesia sp. Xinjiang]